MGLLNFGKLCRGGNRYAVAFGTALLVLMASGVASGQESNGQKSGRADYLGPHAEGAFAPVLETTPTRDRLLTSRLPALVVLDHVETIALRAESASQFDKSGVPLKIGFSREVPVLRSKSQTAAAMAWTSAHPGQFAAINLTSPEAVGIRLGLLVESLPIAAVLRFYGQDLVSLHEVSGQEIMETIARNLTAGDKTDEALTYWSPVIDGQEINLEIELPFGMSQDEVKFSIPRISHLFSSPLDTSALREQIGQSASCNLDSVCYPDWDNKSRATARMVFTDGGVSYTCTGTLMNDSDFSTYIPYFLSANHCISTQTVASTLQTYWFYRSSSCDSGSMSSSMQPVSSGATLLYSSSITDTSFMRLNGAPPSGVYLSGWSATLPAIGVGGIGIHNPHSDLQKISFGSITGYNKCTSEPGSSTFLCTGATAASADHFHVLWSDGIVEGGSSGSGLWAASGSNYYLVGQLHGGNASCSVPTEPSYYGRFGVAYNAALYQWLGSGVSANYTIAVSKAGTGAGTVSSPAGSGLYCGTVCSVVYPSGTSVTLTATATTGSTFTGWSGDCSGAAATCTVSMSQARNVTASFTAG